MNWITDPQIWIGFFTLWLLEIVLGIDNIIFISILAGKLPEDQRKKAWNIGLLLAMGVRILLLLSLGFIVKMENPLFVIPGLNHPISGRDLVLLLGGLFLLYKSVKEIHEKLEGDAHETNAKATSFSSVLIQIIMLDIVFSLDSVITAVGMVKQIGVMIAAVVAAIGVMIFFAQKIASYVDEHPTLKILALSFLTMIGFTLVAEGWGSHIEKGYIYFAMAFSVAVEILNLRFKAKRKPVTLHTPFDEQPPA